MSTQRPFFTGLVKYTGCAFAAKVDRLETLDGGRVCIDWLDRSEQGDAELPDLRLLALAIRQPHGEQYLTPWVSMLRPNGTPFPHGDDRADIWVRLCFSLGAENAEELRIEGVWERWSEDGRGETYDFIGRLRRSV